MARRIDPVGGPGGAVCAESGFADLAANDYVHAGQVIACVGGQPGSPGFDTPHVEVSTGRVLGNLTAAVVLANAPHFRRGDLIDPTASLDEWAPAAARKQSAA